MSTKYSPSVVTNGLIFYYDMNNTAKSWKGQPTTNLCSSNGIHTSWNNSGTAIWSSDDNYVPRVFPSIPVISMYKDTAGNSHIANGFANISSGLVYTVSTYVYIPSNAGTIAGSVPYMRTFPANTSRGSLLYQGSSNWNTWPRDQWIRISNSFTNSAGDTSMYISCYLDNQGNKIYMTAPMVEQQSVLSSYVEISSTRSSTQALLDLTGRNTIEIHGATYNLDNTFSFNGAITQYLTISSSALNNLTSWSINFWLNRTSNNAIDTFLSCGAGNNFLWFFDANGINFQNTASTILGYSVTNNVPFMFTATGSSGTISIYKNGELIGTMNNTTTITVPSTVGQGIVIGQELDSNAGSFDAAQSFIGYIYNVKFYNRVLTSSEIQQNFAALRGRYGV